MGRQLVLWMEKNEKLALWMKRRQKTWMKSVFQCQKVSKIDLHVSKVVGIHSFHSSLCKGRLTKKLLHGGGAKEGSVREEERRVGVIRGPYSPISLSPPTL